MLGRRAWQQIADAHERQPGQDQHRASGKRAQYLHASQICHHKQMNGDHEHDDPKHDGAVGGFELWVRPADGIASPQMAQQCGDNGCRRWQHKGDQKARGRQRVRRRQIWSRQL